MLTAGRHRLPDREAGPRRASGGQKIQSIKTITTTVLLGLSPSKSCLQTLQPHAGSVHVFSTDGQLLVDRFGGNTRPIAGHSIQIISGDFTELVHQVQNPLHRCAACQRTLYCIVQIRPWPLKAAEHGFMASPPVTKRGASRWAIATPVSKAKISSARCSRSM